MPTTRKASSKRKSSVVQKLALLIATRKGLWTLRSDSARRSWKLEGPQFLGQIINHAVLDPRDRRTLLVSASTGHLGPTMLRSTNGGRSFKEVKQPPAFAKVPEGQKGRSVGHTFWLTPAHANEPGVWYAGTSPQGLFRSEDGGDTWSAFSTINDDPRYREWMGTVQDGTPDGPKMHSIIVDPRDPKHLYFGMSGGGVHETRDGGATWKVLIDGMEVVEGFNFDPKQPTFHDPHCLRMCPSNPDRIYQQNHCGIYRIDRPSDKWVRIGRTMPKAVGDIGFPLVVHPRNDKTAWVFPMDGTQVWPRVSPDGKPAVYVTKNAGATWQKQNAGMPMSQGWWTVKRQAMTGDVCDPVGLYFGTTSGEVWASRDEGKTWSRIAEHLPEIYAVEAAVV
jgi:photosystem II stability/assembly factor-like uncharacterized protein